MTDLDAVYGIVDFDCPTLNEKGELMRDYKGDIVMHKERWDAVKVWMRQQVLSMIGCKDPNSPAALAVNESDLREVTEILYSRFQHERASVFILFCGECRARKYKISYGSIKVDAVLEAANEFLKALPKLKERAGDEQKMAARQGKEYDNWKYITYRGLFWARRDSVMDLWERNGAQGLRLAALNEDDAYYASVRTLMGIGALIPNPTMSEWMYDNDKFNAHVERLRLTEDCYRPTRKEEDYHL